MGARYLNLDPKYTAEEIDRATSRLGHSKGGIQGFEFTHENVTEELEKMRFEAWLLKTFTTTTKKER